MATYQVYEQEAQEARLLEEEAMLKRVFPLGMPLNSEVQSFIITALGNPIGKVWAIRIQDIPRDIWYNWDAYIGWTTTGPVGPGPGEGGVTPGTNTLYIAFWAVNNSVTGDMRVTIVDDTGALLAEKTSWVPQGGAIGIEWTGNMPWRNYGIIIEVTP
ncbi:hypothetical protein MUP77_08680 [Candidatus Bathyarchaeota archaeon]|nr:hypothetical protein [Candidatus Bathyarchaeota archaeon]